MSLLQQLWDVGESAGWLSEWWLDSKVGPNKRFLIHAALGDSSVRVYVSVRVHARPYLLARIQSLQAKACKIERTDTVWSQEDYVGQMLRLKTENMVTPLVARWLD
jgi:hypothetical protein